MMTKRKDILPLKSSDYFSDEQWENLTSKLKPAAELLASLAKLAGIRISVDTRWPRIRLKKRRGLRVKIADLQLQQNFLDDHRERWELQLQEVHLFWIFYYRLISVMSVMKLSSQELANDSLIREVIFPKMLKYLND